MEDGDASPTGTHNAPKLAILRSKIEEKNSGEGAQPLPRPLPRGEGVPLHTPPPSRVGFGHIPHTDDFWIHHCF